jgi:phosphopentomutase
MFVLILIDGWVLELNPPPVEFEFLFTEPKTRFAMAKVPYPPLTEPSMAAMFHGVEPSVLEAYFDDEEEYGTYKDYPTGVESLFKVLAKSGKSTAICGGWKGLANEIVEPGFATDYTTSNPGDDVDRGTVRRAAKLIRDRSHDLVVVYFENADHIGHETGFGAEYDKALREIGRKVEQLVSGLRPEDSFLAVSDHGRQISDNGRGHFEFTSLTTRVPFFLRTPNKDLSLSRFVSTVDVMPTILQELGVVIPDWVRSKPAQAPSFKS